MINFYDYQMKAVTTAVYPKTYNISYPALGLAEEAGEVAGCLLYTSPSPRDGLLSRMPSSA